MLKTMSKFQGVLKMFMLGMLKTVLKYKKTTITFYGVVTDSSKIKIEQNSLISFIYFNNLLSFYLTMTRVGRHDKMLKTTF